MIKWHEVTWYSRLGAVLLFIGVMPALSFYIGEQYVEATQIVTTPTPAVSTSLSIAVPMTTAVVTPGFYTDAAIDETLSLCEQKATTNLDDLDCKSEAFDAYTNILNQKLSIVNASLQKEIKVNADVNDEVRVRTLQNVITDIKKSQTDWKFYLDDSCKAIFDQVVPGVEASNISELCYIGLTKRRIYDLCSVVGGEDKLCDDTIVRTAL